MTRLVFITQHVDRDHPLLGATVPMVRALAQRASEVVVLADGVELEALESNTRCRVFAARTRMGRTARFEAALARELASSPRPAAVIAHMCPIYAVLAAPVARPLGVPVFLWYAHWHADRLLELAERVSTRVITVHPTSFPIASTKLRAIGHGIDVAEFPCVSPAPAGGVVRALAVGRYSPAKGLPAIVRALALAADRGVDVRLDAHGPATTPLERDELETLRRVVAELELQDRVTLNGAFARSSLPALFVQHDVLVNNMRPGAPDKVVYEAAAACLPVIASNPAFANFLDAGMRFRHDDAAGLSERLVAFAKLAPEERAAQGSSLRRRVIDRHSVQHWADRIIELATAR